MRERKFDINELYDKKELMKLYVNDLVDSFSTIPNTFIQYRQSKLAKGMAGDIVVFKDSNLYIIDVIFDTKKSYYDYISLIPNYEVQFFNSYDENDNVLSDIGQIMTDKNGNKIVHNYGVIKAKKLLKFKEISKKKNIYCGYIMAFRHQSDSYYVSFGEVWNRIHSTDDTNLSIGKDWLATHAIKLEAVKKNTAWLNEDLEILKQCAIDEYTPDQVVRKYGNTFENKSKKLIKMRYKAMQKKKDYKINKTYVNYIYGTDEIFEDIVEYHKLFEIMRKEQEKKKGWNSGYEHTEAREE